MWSSFWSLFLVPEAARGGELEGVVVVRPALIVAAIVVKPAEPPS
jgi:hypothetical protein